LIIIQFNLAVKHSPSFHMAHYYLAMTNEKLAPLEGTNEAGFDRCTSALKHIDKTLQLFPDFAPAVELARSVCRSLSFLVTEIQDPPSPPVHYKLKALSYAKQALSMPGGGKAENYIHAGNAEADVANADPAHQLEHLLVRLRRRG
jgi:hypothetical protein